MSQFSRFKLVLLAAATGALVLTSGCAGRGGKNRDTAYVARDVDTLYSAAKARLDRGDPRQAAALFDEVERQHPYSTWATKAQLMSAYAYYEDAKYDDAIIALDRFIQLHPGNTDTPYAYYLKALCYYEQISDVGRDQKMTDMARAALEDVINRFPSTSYARDARLKLDLTLDHLAGKEMEVGRWYLRHQKYLAAINRFLVVIHQYDSTSHAPEALYRLTEAYTVLGLKDEARKAAAVLGHNYPGGDWYDDAYDLVERGKTDPSANNAALQEGGENWWDSISNVL